MAGRGGARAGAGSKLSKPIFVPAEVIQGGLAALAEPPVDLPADQRDFWRTWARHAVEAGALNERTAAGFRLLCKMEAQMRKFEAIVEAEGETFQKVSVDGAGVEHVELKAHPLVAKALAIATKVDTMMGRFMLTAYGKPSIGVKVRQSAPNQWAATAGR